MEYMTVIINNTKSGTSFLENLSRDISLEFPSIQGFSIRFAEVYPGFQKGQHHVALLPAFIAVGGVSFAAGALGYATEKWLDGRTPNFTDVMIQGDFVATEVVLFLFIYSFFRHLFL